MKTIKDKFKVNFFTLLYFLIAFLCGYFKPVCIIFFIVCCHELGHILMIRRFHYTISQVELYPFGGMTTIHKPINSSINKELFISISGVGMQLVLQGIILFFYHKGVLAYDTYHSFSFYNKTIFFFNLLPIYPLDGSRFLNALFEKVFAYEKALWWTNLCCFLFYVGFCIYNVVSSTRNYAICSFLLFEFLWILKQQKYLKQKFYLERLLYQFPYQKIENHDQLNIHALKKNTLHFFKYQNRYLHEKALLKKYFQ